MNTLDTRIKTYPVAVDLVILTIKSGELSVLCVKRGSAPFKGSWALPGGFLREGEALADAAHRELKEETGLDNLSVGHLEQLASYGNPDRDPRGTVVSVAYLAFVPDLPLPVAGGDAAQARFMSVTPFLSDESTLAFDHLIILSDALTRTKAKFEYTSLAACFCPAEFTLTDLRKIYETVWRNPLNPSNFQRKVLSTPGFVKETGNKVKVGGRPAKTYTAGGNIQLHPPILRGGL